MKNFFILITILTLIGAGIYYINIDKAPAVGDNQSSSSEQVIANLEAAIVLATERGDYHCCIDPACTMCYLGSWIFDQGTCNCDEMIAKGEFDKVCPECKKGIEKGECDSTTEQAQAIGCEIDKKNHG